LQDDNAGIALVTDVEREIYRSSSDDAWSLRREGDHVFVLHRANEASGGTQTPIELGEFLQKENDGAEHQALRRIIGSLAGQT
jgi:hypothetical protein